MMGYIKAGWKTTKQHPWIISVLFIYQLIWGIFLYQFIQSIVLPLLHRFPGQAFTREAVHLFMAEGQFQLLKTNAADSFLWILLAVFLIRVISTPLLNAGIYYSIHHDAPKQIQPFLRGVREMGKPFIIYYGVQMLLTLIPLYWFVPFVQQLFKTHGTYESIVLALLPWIIGYFIYISLLRIFIMYIQFGRVGGHSLLLSMSTVIRYLVPIITLSFILLLLSGIVALVSLSISMIWAGLFAIILHQLYYLAKTWMKLWEISSQYQLWCSK